MFNLIPSSVRVYLSQIDSYIRIDKSEAFIEVLDHCVMVSKNVPRENSYSIFPRKFCVVTWEPRSEIFMHFEHVREASEPVS